MNKSEASVRLATATRQFYVYLLRRPDGTPFYVGKGIGRRIFFHESEALGLGRSHKLNVIRAITKSGNQVGYDFAGFYESESECHGREIAEIKFHGRHDLKTGPLTNLTDGGEGVAGLSEETKRRIDEELHSDDAPGERGLANRFFHKLCQDVRSVPVRPASEFKPTALLPHRQMRTPSNRMAAALVASAIANRILLEPGCVIPRKFSVEDVVMFLENGVGADILKAGLATLVPGQAPGNELFFLDEKAVKQLIALRDTDLLLDAGILIPPQ